MESVNSLQLGLDVSGLNDGIYLVKMEGIDWAETLRLVVST